MDVTEIVKSVWGHDTHHFTAIDHEKLSVLNLTNLVAREDCC